MGRGLASWLLPLALLGALLGHASHGRADEDDALDRADPAAVAAAGLRALQAGDGETLATLTDWPAVRTALAGDAASAPDLAEVRRTVLAWHRHAAASKDTSDATPGAPQVEVTGDTATARFPAPLHTTLALRRADGVWSLAGWSSLPKALFRPSGDPRVRQHLAFLRACTRLPAVSEDGALEFDGEVLLHDTPMGTLWVGIDAVKDAGRPLWRIQEILRIDGLLEVRREGLFSATLYPVRGLRRERRAGRSEETVMRWHGDGTTLVVTEGKDARTTPFAGAALIGAGPLWLLGRHLPETGTTWLAPALYDDGDGPVELAACTLRIAPGDDRGDGTTVHVDGRAPLQLVFDRGVFRSAAYQYAAYRFALRPRGSETAEGAADPWTRDATTPALAAAQFLHAIQRWRLARAMELVAWERVVPADAEPAQKPAYMRSWMESRRMELRRDTAPLDDDTVLRAVFAALRVPPHDKDDVKIDLPAPWDGWSITVVRRGATWQVGAVGHAGRSASPK